MTAQLNRLSGPEAYDLIFRDYLALLPATEQEVMHRAMTQSTRCWIGWQDDKVLCFLGLIPPTLMSDRAYLWLYTTKHLHEHIFTFVRYSQRVMEEMLREYPIIVGHTETGNIKAIRWLRWLGAVFGEPQGPVIPFEIRAK